MTTSNIKTLGDLMDRCKPTTVLDILFHEKDGVDRYPQTLGFHPTVNNLCGNKWLRSLTITRREHYSTGQVKSGWTVWVGQPFDSDSFWKAVR